MVFLMDEGKPPDLQSVQQELTRVSTDGTYTVQRFQTDALRTHLGPGTFKLAGDALAPLLQGAAVLLVYWLILLWMYRRKLFLKI